MRASVASACPYAHITHPHTTTGLRVLHTSDAFDKARLTLQYADQYQQGALPLPPTLPRDRAEVAVAVPDTPGKRISQGSVCPNDS